MSLWRERLRRRRARADDSGFSLIEVVIALLIFAIVADGFAAVLISSTRGSLTMRDNTTAKNLSQLRLDSMRSLPYHVDAQNGPYVDLLDLYFHDTSGTVDAIPDVVQGVTAASTVPGQYFSASAPVDANDPCKTNPVRPYYRVTVAGSQLGTQYAKFTQCIYTQFLTPQGSASPTPAASPMFADQTVTPPSTYDNSKVGQDTPPSPLIGVTVVTTWGQGASAHQYRGFTEIANASIATSLIVSKATATAVQVNSQDWQGNAIAADVGSVVVNGAVSNGSQSGAQAVGGSIVDGTAVPTTGAQGAAVAPPNPALTADAFAGATTPLGSATPCGWGAMGPTKTSDVSATTAGGLPLAPYDATSSTVAPPTSAQVTASLVSAGAAATCDGLRVSNTVDGSPASDPGLSLPAGKPMVQVADGGLFGGGAIVTGGADVHATSAGGSPGSVTANATTTMATWVKVFPGVPASLGALPYPLSLTDLGLDDGLVNVKLTSATLSCQSSGLGTTAATLQYQGQVVWYTQAGWQSKTFTWNSASPTADPLASSVDLTASIGGGKTLGSYISALSGATKITGSGGGVQRVDGTVTIGTVPTLGSAYPNSTIGIGLGNLTCVAQDYRS